MNNIIIFNALQTSLSGGIGRYSYELSKQLYLKNPQNIKIVIRNEDMDLFDFAKKEDLIIAYNIQNSKSRNIYEQFKLPQLIHKEFPDAIIHYPDSMAPLFARNKVVITIHDLAFKSLKGVFTWKTVLWKNFMTRLSIRKANKIIAITNFTKSELLKHYPRLDKQKINVVYNGFNDFSKDSINENNIRNEIRNLKNYILTVSTISPRKNIDTLIKAFDKVKNEVKDNLVIAGNNGWMYDKIYELVDKLNLKNRIIFTGKVNDDELKYLYKNSRIFTYISIYEGFGLPPLEAMSFNIPCIVSNTSSIPEVVGNYAMKVNPIKVENIADALINLNREYYAKEIKEHLNKFSWNKCAQETYSVYKNIS